MNPDLPLIELPLVSIALCTYNGEQYLCEQLDSLLAQDWPHFEIVVIDDGSTDSTPNILSEYANREPRIRYSCNDVNLGYLRNFERAMSQCQGRWIAPCDQDDVWLPHKISTLVRAMQKPGAKMAYCDSELVDEQGKDLHRRLSDRVRMTSTDDPLTLLFSNMASGHAMLFDRSLLDMAQPFPEHLFHDWWLSAAAAASGQLIFVNECLVRYRQHARNVTDVLGQRTCTHERGFRARELAGIRDRLALFTCLPGPHQATLIQLLTLWQNAENQILAPQLAIFMLRNRSRLYSTSRDSPSRKIRRAFNHLWGLKIKRLVDSHRYT